MQISVENVAQFTRPIISSLPVSAGVVFTVKAIQDGRFKDALISILTGAMASIITTLAICIIKWLDSVVSSSTKKNS